MAISRHDPKWQRVVFMALAAGAVFKEIPAPTGLSHAHRRLRHRWHVSYGGQYGATGFSKYNCALIVLRHMGVAEFLPDAATPRSAPAASPATRTEEFTC
jgi:hypothetical protein